MPINTNNSGTQTITHYFDNISSLTEDAEWYSPSFYNCNTSWQLMIEKTFKGDTPYLALYLHKVDDPYECIFSYEVTFNMTLLSYNEKNTVVEQFTGRSPRSRIVFGTRSGESLLWGWKYFISWNNLLNPNLGYIGDDDDEDYLEIKVNMTVVRIMNHHDDCECPAC